MRWLPVVGYEGRYEVSDTGQVRALPAPGRNRLNAARILTPVQLRDGRWQVILYPGGGQPGKSWRVHVLVLEAFVGPRPPGMFGLHADDDHDNNTLPNLRWGTPSQNSQDMVANGNHNHARKTHCKWGHPLSGDNLRVTTKQRFCRACHQRRNAAYKAQLRATPSVIPPYELARRKQREKEAARRYYLEHREEVIARVAARKKRLRAVGVYAAETTAVRP